jgi:hypothetical protein
MPYRPRAERDFERARAAAIAARAANSSAKNRSAMDRVLAQIGAAFGEAAAVNGFKLRVEQLLRFGPQHPTLRARFGARAAMLSGKSLGAAVALVERRWRDERRAFQIASAFGCGNRLSLEVLRELRLMLRLMRFKGMQPEFGAIVAALRDDVMAQGMAQAAE